MILQKKSAIRPIAISFLTALVLGIFVTAPRLCAAHDKTAEDRAAIAAGATGAVSAATTISAKAVEAHPSASAEVGKAAPDFALTDHNSKPVKLSDFKGKLVILEWLNPGCPFVKRHYTEKTMQSLQKKYASENLVWLRITSTNTDHPEFVAAKDIPAWEKKNGVDGPVLFDSDGAVGHLYGAKTTPHMFVVSADGMLVYSGAIDNDPRGSMESAKRVNYMDGILGDWKAGKQLAPTANDPYGCGVKYRK